MLSIISFTSQGLRLSQKILEGMGQERAALYTKCSMAKEEGLPPLAAFVEEPLGVWAGRQMEEKNALLFIGACGIAVRAVAPSVINKLKDSPVLVMDEFGAYVIPILSGHVGGANALALELAKGTGAAPVITTATDLHKQFAVDLFAGRNHLHIANKDGIAKVSAKVLAGKEITLSVETGHLDPLSRGVKGVRLCSYPPREAVDILVTGEEDAGKGQLLLRPKEYVVGMGCRKGKEEEKIRAFMEKCLQENGIFKSQIFALASIDRKKGEEGFLSWSRKEGVPFFTYSAEELWQTKGSFCSSEFVRSQVGVDNVCERAALLACGPGGRLVQRKTLWDGMTLAIGKKEWKVTLDEAED